MGRMGRMGRIPLTSPYKDEFAQVLSVKHFFGHCEVEYGFEVVDVFV
jgi:hypothetical protein